MSSTNNDDNSTISPVDGLTQKFSEVLDSHRNQIHLNQATTSTNRLTSSDAPYVNGNHWTRQSTIDSIRVTDDDDDDDDESDSGEESDSRCGSECSDSYSDAASDLGEDDSTHFKRKLISFSRWMKELDPVRQATAFCLLAEDASPASLALISNHRKLKQLDQLDEYANANSVNFLQEFSIAQASSSPQTTADFLLEHLPLVNTDRFPSSSSLVLSYLHLLTSTLDSFLTPPVDQMRAAELVALSMLVPLFSLEQKETYLKPYASKVHLASGANNLPDLQNNVPIFDVSKLPPIPPFSGPGMADVPAYLKSLRLHKYTQMFASIPSLSHFLALTEDQLEKLGVAAKGARKKFVQSLQKLRDRSTQLESVMNCTSPSEALQVIASVISAPLSTDSTEVNLIMRLLLKLRDQVKGTDNEKELRLLVQNCLKQSCWSRQNSIILLQLIDE